MGSITCERTSCKHNKKSSVFSLHGANFCKRGSGYDYGGGDIKISKTGHCMCFEKLPKKSESSDANRNET